MTPDQITALFGFVGPAVFRKIVDAIPGRSWDRKLISIIARRSEFRLSLVSRILLRRVLVSDLGWNALIEASAGKPDALTGILYRRVLPQNSPKEIAADIAAALVAALPAALGLNDFNGLLDARLRDMEAESSKLVLDNLSHGPLARQLGRNQYSALIRAQARLRRFRLRQATGLSELQVGASFRFAIPLPTEIANLKAGTCLFVAAPLGSGKSDIGLRWLAESGASANHRLPVLLNADEIGEGLLLAVAQFVSLRDLTRFGIDLYIDGLDESATRFQRIAEDSVAFAMQWPLSRVLVSSRASALPPNAESIELKLLEEPDALEMIEALTDDSAVTSRWSAELRETVRRPLFALLAARYSSEKQSLSPYELLESLARDPHLGGGHAAALRDLAVAVTRNDSAVDPLTIPSLRDLDASALAGVVNTKSKLWNFELPILGQWHAARAVLSGDVNPREYMGSLDGFARWRYVLAVAVSSGTAVTVDAVLAHLAAWGPGAVGWVMKEVSMSAIYRPLEHQPTWREMGARLVASLDAIEASAGSAAHAIALPYLPGRSLAANEIVVGAAPYESGVSIGWGPKQPDQPRFVEMRPDEFRTPRSLDSWILQRVGPLPDQTSWPWKLNIDHARIRMNEMLMSPERLAGPTSPLRSEYLHWCWSKLTMRGRQPLQERLDALGDLPQGVGVSGGRIEHWAISELRARTDDWSVYGPWSRPDLATGRSQWIGSNFSNEQLRRRATEVYSAAIAGYEELVTNAFASFRPFLELAITLPIALTGHVHSGVEYGPGISVSYVPNNQPGATSTVTITASDERATFVESDWEPMLEAYRQLWIAKPGSDLFAGVSHSSSILHIFGERAATAIAIDWLSKDLATIGWADGRNHAFDF